MAKLKTVIEIDHKAFDQGLVHVERSLKGAEGKVSSFGNSLNKSTKGLGASLASLAARYLSAIAVLKLATSTVKSAIEVNAKFERKNSELASVLGTSKKGVEDLSKAAAELGRVTEFTSTEVTELQLALARLGFTKTQILDMQETVLKFAGAVNADLGRAADFAGAALRGFGLESKDTQHLLDVMAASTSKSALNFSKLETSISIVAPVAHTFGLSVEDTVTLLGALSNAGFDASSAATATRNILLNLADSNGKLAKGLGHTAKTFPEIIDALKECNKKGLDLNATLEMTDKRSVAAFNSLITGAASADELRKALGNVDGTLDQMYSTMTDNLIGAVRALKSAWEGLLLSFNDEDGVITKLINKLTSLVNKITDARNAAKERKNPEGKKADAAQLREDFMQRGDLYGREAMLSAFEQWERDAQADLDAANKEWDKAREAFHNSNWRTERVRGPLRDANKHREEAQSYVNALAGMKEFILAYEPQEKVEETPTTTPTLTDEQKKAIKRFGEAYKKAVKEMWKSVDNAHVEAMKEGAAKRLAQIDNEEKQALAAIAEEFTKLQEAAQKSGNTISAETLQQFESRRNDTMTAAANKRQEIYDEQLQNQLDYLSTYGTYKEKELAIARKYDLAISKEQDEWKQKSLTKEKADALAQLHESELSYLEQYGTYKEKELAITEKYNSQIARSNDEIERKMLEKERDKALRDLEQTYDSKYSLIFADASSLSKTVLQQAIEATQKAIEKARNSGDIQALTELYGRLREQLNVQGDHQRGWGWSGISEGFGLRSSANAKRSQADSLEELLKNSEGSIEVMKELGLSEEDIQASREECEQLRAEIQRLRDDAANEDTKALDFLQKGFKEVGDVLSSLGSSMSSFRDGLGGACDTIADIGDGFSGIASQVDKIGEAFSGTMSKGDAWSTAISGAIQLIAMVGQSIVNNKKAQEEWNKTIEQSAHRLAMLKLEAMDYKQQNIFGVENPYKKAIDGAAQYSAAMLDLRKQTAALADGQVQTGTKKAVDWGNVGKGAGVGVAAGAALGSVIPGIGTAIGAAVGGAIGLIAGLVSTKTVPVFESLSSQYGELFNPDTYELNEQLLADYDKLDDATKQIVDNWQEVVDKAKEAEQQMRDNFSAISGDIGSQLSDSLVAAFRNGDLYAAIDDFHGKMTSTIEDIMEQLVFSTTMGAMFDQLEDRMMKSFGVGGDQDIVDDLIWMESEYQKRLDQYNEAMTEVQKSLRGLGYDAWESDDQRTAQTKSTINASQDSVDESNARLTTIQGHTFEMNENVRIIREQHQALIANTAALLEHVQGIHSDTGEMKATAAEIQKMVTTIKSGVGTIVDKGVKAL